MEKNNEMIIYGIFDCSEHITWVVMFTQPSLQMGSRLYCMRWLVIQANLILMVSQLYTTLSIALSISYLPLSSGLRSCSLSTRHLDDDRQVVLGGVAEEPLVHGHHLHHPHLLHRHDPPLLLRMLRRHEGDQVLPTHVRDPHHHHPLQCC